MPKQWRVRSIKFDLEMERKIRVLAAEAGISFGEWVRRACEEELEKHTGDASWGK